MDDPLVSRTHSRPRDPAHALKPARYILTDVEVERATLDKMLREAVNKPTSFNSMSVDSDESTSDTVVAVSSNMVPCNDESELGGAISQVCAELSDDVVRNGEGTNHVVEVIRPYPALPRRDPTERTGSSRTIPAPT